MFEKIFIREFGDWIPIFIGMVLTGFS